MGAAVVSLHCWERVLADCRSGRRDASLWLHWVGARVDYRRGSWSGGLCGALPCSNACCEVDDPCDVFGVLRRLWYCRLYHDRDFAASSLGGVGFAEGVTMGHQLLVQLESIAITIVWSGVVAFIAAKLADLTVGLRVPEEQERSGLDVNSHGECL